MTYRKVLLALDFGADNKLIIDRATEVVRQNDAELLLVHVEEPIVGAYSLDPMGGMSQQVVEIEAVLRKNNRDHMKEMSTKLSVPEERCFIRNGRAAAEIKELAIEQEIDLIVLGTHGQHGLALLLGSTANAVLHGVSCDVLVVRVPG